MSSEVDNVTRARSVQRGEPLGGLSVPGDSVEQLVFCLPARRAEEGVPEGGPAESDMHALADAWQRIAARHAILRGRQATDEPGADRIPVRMLDWSLPEDERQRKEQLASLLAADRLQGFNEDGSQVFRVTLILEPPGMYRVVLSMRHGLLDWRSMSTLLREFLHEYKGDDRGSEVAAMLVQGPQPAATFLAGSIDTNFWQTYLDGLEPSRIELPAARHEDPAATKTQTLEIHLDNEQGDTIRRLRKAAGVTLNNLVQATWSLLLSHYTSSDDVVFGITRSCRRSGPPGAADAIGPFTNVIPLRVGIRPEHNVFELLWHVRDQYRKVREHECSPLPLVQRCTGIGQGQQLFDSVVEFDLRDPMQAMQELFSSSGLTGFAHHAGAWSDIDLQVFGEDEIVVRLKYRTERHDRETAQQLLSHFVQLMVSMAWEPWLPAKDISYLSEEESAPCRWPGPRRKDVTGKAHTLHGRFEDQARATPDAIAVSCGPESLGYGELERQAADLARRLVLAGVTPGMLVGLCADRSLEQLIGLLAILKAGAGYLPLDPAYPHERMKFMLKDSGVGIVVASRLARDRLPEADYRVVDIVGDDTKNGDRVELPVAVDADSIAYVIYTSGSTGKPKGVQVTHRNVTRLFDACRSWLDPGIGDVWTLFHSYAFDFSVWEIWGALLHGGRLEVVPQDIARSPESFHALLAERGVTILNQTPSAFMQLMKADGQSHRKLSALRCIVFGGEALDVAALAPWIERYGDRQPRLVNMYGITETTVHVTYRPILRSDIDKANAAAGSPIGVPLADLYVRLLDEAGRPVPPGVAGEICVGGAGVTRGYLGRPELNAQHFIDDPYSSEPGARLYRSGDFARRMPDGELYYLGRRDSQVKIRGYRIDLGEVSNTVKRLDGIEDGIAMVRKSQSGEPRLVVYYVAADEQLVEARVREQLRHELPPHMMPAALIRLSRIPVNANNKIDFKALPAADSRPVSLLPGEQPSNEMERVLAGIWADVLERPQVGRDDDFFGLGGDSVSALQIVSQARAAGIEISPRDIFKQSSLAALAQTARSADANKEQEGADLKLEGPCGLTPTQKWFFDQDLEKPGHFNHAYLFRVPPGCNTDLLERACHAVVAHHDALRVRFTQDEKGDWQGQYVRPEEAFEFSHVELDHLDQEERREAIRLITREIHDSLSISSGLLMRVAHFAGGLEDGDRLLVVIHQLAVDDLSWKIILQDIDTAYRALRAGRQPAFFRTTSHGQWAARLAQQAASPSVAAEATYWRKVMETPAASPWPAANVHAGKEGNAVTHRVLLEAPDTAALLGGVHQAYGSKTMELLLAGLVKACAGFGQEHGFMRIDIEHHGRDHDFKGIDLSRTVGWFNILRPLVLDLSAGGNTAQCICDVKSRLRSAANQGMGFGLLRYLHPQGAGNLAVGAGKPAPILFNYVGRGEQLLADGSFQHVNEDAGPWRAPDNNLSHALAITGKVHDDRLEFTFRHDPGVVPPESVAEFAEGYVNALQEIVRHCRSRDRASRTPYDFPLARLSQQELDAFPVSLEQAEDILPLSPLQRLYHALSGTESDVGFDQWIFNLEGSIDERAFENAWRQLISRHDALRTIFVDRRLGEPHQVILRNVDFRLQRTDWRLLSPGEQQKRLSEFLEADRQQGFDPAIAPLTRVTLIRVGASRWTLVWSHWQAQVDGWSWPILARELGEIHDAIVENRQPRLAPPGSYRAYIAWLMERNLDEYAEFWRNHLGLGRGPRSLISRTRRKGDTQHGARHITHKRIELTAELSSGIGAAARQLKLTPSVLFQAAWALVTAGLTQSFNVTLGVAFSGRTAGIPVSDNTVGPFVNDLPVRIPVPPSERINQWLSELREMQTDINHYQNVSPSEIHQWSGNRGASRMFDTLLVFQNYATGKAAERWARNIRVEGFTAGVRTNYPMTVAVTPGERYQVDFFYGLVDKLIVKSLARHLVTALNVMTRNPDVRIDTLLKHITETPAEPSPPQRPGLRNRRASDRQAHAGASAGSAFAPRNADTLEGHIAEICREVLDVPDIRLEENFFELGAQSVSLIEIHARLQKDLERTFPIVKLFQHPTVSALAKYLEQGDPDDGLWATDARSAARRAALQRRKQSYQSGRHEG